MLTANDAGTKALHLVQLQNRGFRVPNTHVLATEFFWSWMNSIGVTDEFCANLRSKPDALEQLENISKKITIESLTPNLNDLLEAFYAKANIKKHSTFILRSAALGEDGKNFSFAGQLKSVKASEGLIEFKHALVECAVSYFSKSLWHYQQSTKTWLKGLSLILQPFEEALYSGVFFSESPSFPMAYHVEFIAGDCEKVVTGTQTPSFIVFDRKNSSTIQLEIQSSEKFLLLDNLFVETFTQKLQLLCTQLKSALNLNSLDMEWLVTQDGEFVVLQARELTHTSHQPSQEKISISNANIAENYPEAVTTFQADLCAQSFSHYYQNLARQFGFSHRKIESLGGVWNCTTTLYKGRIYYQLSNIRKLFTLLPFAHKFEKLFDNYLDTQLHNESNQKNSEKFSNIKLAKLYSISSL
jgi:rifampicin phosphotransferase